jgi:hypothetical protein
MPNAKPKPPANLPATVEAAVRLLQGLVPDDEQTRIAFLPESELPTLDFGLGQWVRNNLGLWGGNADLLADAGAENADDASVVIVRAFWLELKNGLPRVH